MIEVEVVCKVSRSGTAFSDPCNILVHFGTFVKFGGVLGECSLIRLDELVKRL